MCLLFIEINHVTCEKINRKQTKLVNNTNISTSNQPRVNFQKCAYRIKTFRIQHSRSFLCHFVISSRLVDVWGTKGEWPLTYCSLCRPNYIAFSVFASSQKTDSLESRYPFPYRGQKAARVLGFKKSVAWQFSSLANRLDVASTIKYLYYL